MRPALTPARQAGTRFTYPGGMEGWVDLGSLIVAQPGSRTHDRLIANPTPWLLRHQDAFWCYLYLCSHDTVLWLLDFVMKLTVHCPSIDVSGMCCHMVQYDTVIERTETL